MSLFGKLFKGLKKVVRGVASVGQFVPGPIGVASRGFNALDATVRGISGRRSAGIQSGRLTSRLAAAQPQSLLGANSLMSLNRLPTLARGAGQLVRRAGGVLARKAGTIGTVATVGAILYDANGNPVRRKRPRGKGITARELKSFTRVTHLLNKYCKTPPPTKRRTASKGRSCR